MSSIQLSQFNIGGTWSELHLNGSPPSLSQINVGCYAHDLDTGTIYYRTISDQIIIIAFNGNDIAVATPNSVGTVYGLVDNGSRKTGNTGLGYQTLEGVTSGTNNTAVGERTLGGVNTGVNNVAVGNSFSTGNPSQTTTLGAGNTTSSSSLTRNITVGSSNTVDGNGSIVIGNGITASAHNTLYLGGSNITSVVLPSNLVTTTAATYGIVDNNGSLAVGPITSASIPDATYDNIGGVYGVVGNSTNQNTGIGLDALASTTGTNNTAMGYKALNGTTTGINNVCVGDSFASGNPSYTTTIGSGNTTSVTLSGNITVGYDNTISGEGIIIGNGNTIDSGITNSVILGNNTIADASGTLYLDKNITEIIAPGVIGTTAANYGLLATTSGTVTTLSVGPITSGSIPDATPTAIGGVYGLVGTSSDGNTGVGLSVLATGTNLTGTNNTAVGYEALPVNTKGNSNVAVGYQSLDANTTGSNNTAIGTSTLISNITGSNNTAVGNSALSTNTANNNTAVGSNVLTKNTSGTDNTAVGTNTLISLDNISASNNTVVGANALYLLTSGTNNVSLGDNFTSNRGGLTTATYTTTVGSANTSGTATTLSDNITVGYNNAINSSDIMVLGNNNTVNQGIPTNSSGLSGSIFGSNNTLGTTSAIFGNGNNIINTANSVIFGEGIVDSLLTPIPPAGTIYFDPKLTNLHLPPLPSASTAPSTVTFTPLLLGSNGYVYQSTTPLYVAPLVDYYYATSSTQSINLDVLLSTTLIYNNLITDTLGGYDAATGVFTAPSTATYSYEYNVAILPGSSILSLSLANSVDVLTTTTSGSTTVINSAPNVLAISLLTPIPTVTTIFGLVSLSAGDTLYSTYNVLAALSVGGSATTGNSYMKITQLP